MLYHHKNDEFIVIRKRSSKQPTYNKWILLLSALLMKRIIADGGVLVGRKRCRLRPFIYISVLRWFKCQQLGHSEKRSINNPVCVLCRTDYSSGECSQILSCVDCKSYNTSQNTELQTDQKYSDPSCAMYKHL